MPEMEGAAGEDRGRPGRVRVRIDSTWLDERIAELPCGPLRPSLPVDGGDRRFTFGFSFRNGISAVRARLAGRASGISFTRTAPSSGGCSVKSSHALSFIHSPRPSSFADRHRR